MNKPLPADMARFGDRLRWAIVEGREITQTAFAEEIEATVQSVSNWIARDEAPIESTVRMLSEALGVPPVWLRYGIVPPEQRKPAASEEGRVITSEPMSDPERLQIIVWLSELQRAIADGPLTSEPPGERAKRLLTRVPPLLDGGASAQTRPPKAPVDPPSDWINGYSIVTPDSERRHVVGQTEFDHGHLEGTAMEGGLTAIVRQQ